MPEFVTATTRPRARPRRRIQDFNYRLPRRSAISCGDFCRWPRRGDIHFAGQFNYRAIKPRPMLAIRSCAAPPPRAGRDATLTMPPAGAENHPREPPPPRH
jgi:hypothetical protein